MNGKMKESQAAGHAAGAAAQAGKTAHADSSHGEVRKFDFSKTKGGYPKNMDRRSTHRESK